MYLCLPVGPLGGHCVSSHQLTSPTFLQDRIPLRSINLLSPNDEVGGISKVDELAPSMEVQSSGVHQILDGDHVLIWNLGVHVHAPDDPRAAFSIDQEELMLRFCSETTKQRQLMKNTASIKLSVDKDDRI